MSDKTAKHIRRNLNRSVCAVEVFFYFPVSAIDIILVDWLMVGRSLHSLEDGRSPTGGSLCEL